MQRIIRISDEVRISLDEVKESGISNQDHNEQEDFNKLTTSKLAAKHKIKPMIYLSNLCKRAFNAQ